MEKVLVFREKIRKSVDKHRKRTYILYGCFAPFLYLPPSLQGLPQAPLEKAGAFSCKKGKNQFCEALRKPPFIISLERG